MKLGGPTISDISYVIWRAKVGGRSKQKPLLAGRHINHGGHITVRLKGTRYEVDYEAVFQLGPKKTAEAIDRGFATLADQTGQQERAAGIPGRKPPRS